MQSLVRTNASDWSGRMQTGGQVERNFGAMGSQALVMIRRTCCEQLLS